MRLSKLKETTSHGLRWNNSLVSPAVLFCFFSFFAEVCYLICMLACDKDELNFQEKHIVNIIVKQRDKMG